ncbi:MAG: N-acetyltransferase, partial [Pseudomonadota bacterium]|nr:N-acetyltransferase [Pseudomonadota bacterium]
SFYESNGFVPFGKRKLDSDETDLKGSYLIQLLKKIK